MATEHPTSDPHLRGLLRAAVLAYCHPLYFSARDAARAAPLLARLESRDAPITLADLQQGVAELIPGAVQLAADQLRMPCAELLGEVRARRMPSRTFLRALADGMLDEAEKRISEQAGA